MKKQVLLLLAIIIANVTLSFAQAKISDVGVQLYSFREALKADVAGSLQKIKNMGITHVEAAGYYGLTAAEFTAITDKTGLIIDGTSVEFNDLNDPAKLKSAIADAKTTKAKYMVCFWIPHKEGGFTLQETEVAIATFNKAGKEIAKNGLFLMYHPHGYEFRPYGNEYLFDLLVKKTMPSYLSFEADINWIFHAGHNPASWILKYPNRWKAMHIKDRFAGTPCNQFGRMDVELYVPVGTGEVNIDESVRAGQKVGIKYFFIEDESKKSFENTPKSITYLRKLFK